MLTKEQKARKAATHKLWARKNRLKRLEYRKKLMKLNPEYRLKCIELLRKTRIEKPWLGHYDSARTRCTNSKRQEYPRYGGRGIKFLLTHSDIKNLWFKYKAFTMKAPNLDRINNDGNYEISNCRFIEKSVNSTKGNYEARWK